MNNNLSKKECAAGYIRLSKDDLKESNSIINQKKIIQDYCKENKIKLYDFYIDSGYSGGNFERPAFKIMLESLKTGYCSIVITKDVSRLGRDFVKTGEYIFKYFPEHGIKYISILENFDTMNPNGIEDLIPFQTVMNDLYLKDISMKIKSVRHEKMKKGDYVGSTIPYGYKRDERNKKKFVIDEYASMIVKKIFYMKKSGKTNKQIADLLSEDGILPPNVYNRKNTKKSMTTNLWKTSTINHILQNEVYIGNLIQGKYSKVNYKSKKKILLSKDKWIIVKNNHPAIISQELFDIVNGFEKNNDNIRNYRHDFLLKGLVVCADCGKTMIARKSYYKLNKNYNIRSSIYCCKTYAKFGKKVCSMHYYKEENLNYIIKDKVKELIKTYSDIDVLKEIYYKNKNKIFNVESYKTGLKLLNSKLIVIEKALNDLYIDKEKEIVSNDEFYEIKNNLNDEIKKIENNITNIKCIINQKFINYTNNYTRDNIIKSFLEMEMINKAILSKFIKKIEIDEKKNIKIFFKFTLRN